MCASRPASKRKRRGLHVEEGFGEERESLKEMVRKSKRERETVYVREEDAVAREQR